MDLFAISERAMGMSDETWARHASPWSVYTRFLALPLLALAIWSRVWIGPYAWLAVAAALIFIWVNPRAFPPPTSRNHWAAEGTFGERVWLNRKSVPVPEHHKRWAIGLTWLSATGLPPFVWGLWQLDLAWMICGMTLMIGGKTWFVDRMVWLYRDMKHADPEYASWQDE